VSIALCYIAIVADDEVSAEVKAFQQFAADNFDSKSALRSPPHITLEPPFKWRSDRFDVLETALQSFAHQHSGFPVKLTGFNKFSSRVIFIDVEPNQPLQQLQQSLKTRLRSDLDLVSERPDRPYHPHMTVAFRDLRKNRFLEAWHHFSNIDYQREMKVSRITLLQHNGRIWQRRMDFEMKGLVAVQCH
jgi:2'-5' RNA ligase